MNNAMLKNCIDLDITLLTTSQIWVRIKLASLMTQSKLITIQKDLVLTYKIWNVTQIHTTPSTLSGKHWITEKEV